VGDQSRLSRRAELERELADLKARETRRTVLVLTLGRCPLRARPVRAYASGMRKLSPL